MAEFKQGEIVTIDNNAKGPYLMVSDQLGSANDTFAGVVIKTGTQTYYKLGETSKSWHKDKFVITDHIINLNEED